MNQAAAIAASILLAAFAPTDVQEPPHRFTTQQCAVKVAFYPPREVRRICAESGVPAPEPGLVILACYWRAGDVMVMPDPWHCGGPDRCAALWRHEVAHACKDWRHEDR